MSLRIYNNTIADFEGAKLLSITKLQRLASADFSTAIKTLLEYGYVATDNNDIDLFMSAQYNRLKDFIDEYCDNKNLKTFLLNRFNFVKDNSKTPEETTDIDLLKAKHSKDLETSKKLGKNYLAYSKLEIDLATILTSYRATKLAFNYDKLSQELFDGGTINLDEFEVLKTKGFSALATELQATPLENPVNALLNNDITLFRKSSSETLYNTLAPEFESFLKFGPLLKYCINCVNEYKIVNYILVALKNNISLDLTKLWSAAHE